MDWQAALAALIVAGCFGYAAWALMPAALRQRLRRMAGAAPAADTGCGGGCKGCGPAPGALQVVRVVRRRDAG